MLVGNDQTHLAIVVGAQVIFLAAFARFSLAQTGLLPRLYRRSLRLSELFTLERVLIAGIVLLALGIGGSVAAVFRWGGLPITADEISGMMRLVVPSVTAVALGLEACFAAFALGVLRIETGR